MATTTDAPTTSRRELRTARPWRSWSDWVALGLGAYLALAPLWTGGAPAAWFATLGVLTVAVALWALGTSSSAPAEWTQAVVGVVTFFAPWIGDFAGEMAAAWTARVVGVAVAALAAFALAMAARTKA